MELPDLSPTLSKGEGDLIMETLDNYGMVPAWSNSTVRLIFVCFLIPCKGVNLMAPGFNPGKEITVENKAAR